jgi:hypothetical protein
VGTLDRTEQDLGVTVRFDHYQRRLGRDAEASEDGSGIVADLRERQRVLVDELLERRIVTRPCDTDEFDPPSPLLCCCFDRSSFCITDRSSRRPEPEGCRTTGVVSAGELAARDEWCAELQQFWDGCRAGRRAGPDGCLVRRRRRRATSGQQSQQDNGGQRLTRCPENRNRSFRERVCKIDHRPIIHRSAREVGATAYCLVATGASEQTAPSPLRVA